MKKSCRRKRVAVFILILILLSAVAGFILFEFKMSEVVQKIAEQRVKSEATLIISRKICEEIQKSHITYDSLVSFEKNSEGAITALKTNIIEVNRLKASLSLDMLEELKKMQSLSVVVPIGSFFNSQILSGRGPKVNVKVIPVGTAAVDITNGITSAGINQTRHQIMLSVNVQIAMITATKRLSTEISTNMCIAETVIVGNVPESYTNIDASTGGANDENNDGKPLVDPDTLFNFIY